MNFVAWFIVASEIAFWIVIILGLAARYLFKQKKLGMLLLALTPLIDLILLIITTVDLYRGAAASTAHALSAVYIGVSIAFGKSMIEWADERFRYYVTKEGPKPKALYGTEHAKHYLKSWFRHALAYAIGAGLLAASIYLIDDASRTKALAGVMKTWTVVLGIDLIIAVSYYIWPKKAKA